MTDLTEVQNFFSHTYLIVTDRLYIQFIYHYRNMDSGM